MTASKRAQGGLSMIGFLFVAVVIAVVAMVGFRVAPSYVEYFTIRSAIESLCVSQKSEMGMPRTSSITKYGRPRSVAPPSSVG